MSYEEGPYIAYGDDGATFLRVCSKCRRFVKADKTVLIGEESGVAKQPNATCRKCGRVEMEFVGFY